jgi:RHS repeat-associated protein
LQRLTSTSRTGGSVSYGYSANGNLTSKSDFGSYSYAGINSRSSGCGPHATYAAGGFTYACDANGNVYGGSTLSIQYDADNHPRTASRGGASGVTWGYDANGGMDYESSSRGTRYFAPGGYEQVGVQGIHELGPIIVTRSGGTDTVTTALRGRLGSTIDTIEAGFASSANARDYDAFGASRNGDMSARPNGTLNLADTIHGFTKHEHADDVWLIHMGGRIYDYQLGRFLNVDPVIQNPLSSQSLNPYSYVGNNPLSGTDPTGYQCESMTGTHNCGLDTGARNGKSTETGRITDPKSGQTVTFTKTVTASGTAVFMQVGNSGSGARLGAGTKPVEQTGGAKNGSSTIDGQEHDPGQQQLTKATAFGKAFGDAGEKTLEFVEPVDPDHPLASIVAGAVAGKVLKAGAEVGGETMRALGRKLGLSDEEINTAMGAYRDVGGHHVHAKAAFRDDINYDLRQGFSISQDFMQRMGWDHDAMTQYQRRAFNDLAKSGNPNTMQEQSRIAVEALMAGGATRDQARSVVSESLRNLRNQNVRQPTGIPWNQQ